MTVNGNVGFCYVFSDLCCYPFIIFILDQYSQIFLCLIPTTFKRFQLNLLVRLFKGVFIILVLKEEVLELLGVLKTCN